MILFQHITANKIKTENYINESLTAKRFSLAAVGRAILNDDKWGKSIGLRLGSD